MDQLPDAIRDGASKLVLPKINLSDITISIHLYFTILYLPINDGIYFILRLKQFLQYLPQYLPATLINVSRHGLSSQPYIYIYIYIYIT